MTPFICLEGVDGAGKTRQADLLADVLRQRGEDPLLIRFPARTTPYGRLIDGHLRGYWSAMPSERAPGSSEGVRVLNAQVFQALQVANRMECMPGIHAALAEDRPVVADRYWPSGYAYGKADGLDPEYLIATNSAMAQPRLFLLLDVPQEVAVARQVARGVERDRIERAVHLLSKVREGYLELWHSCAGLRGRQEWVVVDGTGTEEAVHGRIWAEVQQIWGYGLGWGSSTTGRR